MFQFEIEDQIPERNDGNTNQEILTEFKIGDRIKSENDFGEVRYIGSVNPHPGVWLGIEWENPSRGKHDGSVDGIQYFKCVQHQQSNSASFIRPHKAKKIRDINSALHERYGHDESVMNSLKLIDERIEIMRVVYSELRIVDLSGRGISDLGKPDEFPQNCPNIEFLNLADNLITSWDSVASICRHLSRLRRLDISENPLVEEENVENIIGSFERLEHLILGRVKYDWAKVMQMSVLWPQLTNLQLQFNQISTIFSPRTSLLNLTSLDLEGNLIAGWEEVIKLNVCHSLEYLNLSRNKIECIRFSSIPDLENNIQTTDIFPNLVRLSLTENKVQSWFSINELNKLGKLSELRVDLNPFLEKDIRASNRQMIIARIGKLQKLEGVEINRQERRDAELDYIKKFCSKWTVEGTNVQFAVDHPRYLELIKKLGESQDGEVSTGGKTMKTKLINLEFIPEDSSYKPYSKQLMPNMTVQKLKMLLQRNFKLRSSRITIKVVSTRNPDISFTLENDFFDLTQYSIEDGDKLFLSW